MHAREALGDERQRLWDLVQTHRGYGDDIAAFARLRSSETAVVVLEPAH